MSWVKKNKGKIVATKDFIALFESKPSHLFSWINKGAEQEEKILRALCTSMLYQQISQDHLLRFLQNLWKEYPQTALLNLPAPKEKTILQIIAVSMPPNSWSISAHVPGIIWSLGEYFRDEIRPNVRLWLSQSELSLWRSLSQIYFAGKSSPIRPKILRFIDLLRFDWPLGLALWRKEEVVDLEVKEWPIAINPGASRWMQRIGPGKLPWFKKADLKKQLQFFQEFYVGLNPKSPQLVYHGLQFYADPVAKSYLCRDIIGKCHLCPIYDFCFYKKVYE